MRHAFSSLVILSVTVPAIVASYRPALNWWMLGVTFLSLAGLFVYKMRLDLEEK